MFSGLGEVGRPLFDLLSQAHRQTIGVDLEELAIDQKVGIVDVCYRFHNLTAFIDIGLHYISKHSPDIVVISSTVTPGTTNKLQEAAGVSCVYSLVRGKHLCMHDDLRRYRKFIAGSSHESVDRIAHHFESAGITTARMSTPGTLELAKLFETTYFGLLIARAQDMDRFSDSCGSYYLEATTFFGEIDYFPRHIVLPGFIGGHCVMPNIKLLSRLQESPILSAIEQSNALRAQDLDDLNSKQQGSASRSRIGTQVVDTVIAPVPMDDGRRHCFMPYLGRSTHRATVKSRAAACDQYYSEDINVSTILSA